jgi:hypothetical protein
MSRITVIRTTVSDLIETGPGGPVTLVTPTLRCELTLPVCSALRLGDEIDLILELDSAQFVGLEVVSRPHPMTTGAVVEAILADVGLCDFLAQAAELLDGDDLTKCIEREAQRIDGDHGYDYTSVNWAGVVSRLTPHLAF